LQGRDIAKRGEERWIVRGREKEGAREEKSTAYRMNAQCPEGQSEEIGSKRNE
jgi:hypothetical protein